MAVKKPLVLTGGEPAQLQSGDYIAGTVTWELNGTPLTGQQKVIYKDVAIAGGAGVASLFLTSDGLTKGAGNTFLYTTVVYIHAVYMTINGITTARFQCGVNYNTGTGLLQVKIGESNTSSIGALGGTAEGLEVAPNAVTVRLKYEVIV